MKSTLKKYLQKLRRLGGGRQGGREESTLLRDWHGVLSVSAVVLAVFMGVGAHTFMVTIKNVHTDNVTSEPYQVPTDKETMLKTLSVLKERTVRFETLRQRAPEVPDTGGVSTGEPELELEETNEESGVVEVLF